MKQTQEMNIHAVGGFRTRVPSNQADADLRIKRHRYWDRIALL